MFFSCLKRVFVALAGLILIGVQLGDAVGATPNARPPAEIPHVPAQEGDFSHEVAFIVVAAIISTVAFVFLHPIIEAIRKFFFHFLQPRLEAVRRFFRGPRTNRDILQRLAGLWTNGKGVTLTVNPVEGQSWELLLGDNRFEAVVAEDAELGLGKASGPLKCWSAGHVVGSWRWHPTPGDLNTFSFTSRLGDSDNETERLHRPH